jgi:hypothetical protein
MNDPAIELLLLLELLDEEFATFRGGENVLRLFRRDWERMGRLGEIRVDVYPWSRP